MIKRRMFSKIVGTIMLGLMISSPCSAYINQSAPTPGNEGNTFNKLVNYIEKFKSMGTGTVFAIDRDIIHYHETFSDIERDYEGISLADKLLSNGSLSEDKKKNASIDVQIKYQHDPSVYRNSPDISSLSGNWYNAKLEFDRAANKWRIKSDVLFTHPGDDKRGDWTITLRTRDVTTKPLFDKYAENTKTFTVHKPPVPMLELSQNNSTAILRDTGSYDVDGPHKNRTPVGYNYNTDNGIKKREWAAKIGDKWVELTTANATFTNGGKTVTFNTGNQTVTDYRLTVWDYDDVSTSISKQSLVFERPAVDFNFEVAGSKATYVYQGNVNHEPVNISSLISANDDAYSAAAGYVTSGQWRIEWDAFRKDGTRVETNASIAKPPHNITNPANPNKVFANTNSQFSTLVANNWSSLTNRNSPSNPKLEVELLFVNAYDLTGTSKQAADIKVVSANDATIIPQQQHENGSLQNEFLIGTDAIIQTNVFTDGVKGINDEELKVVVHSSTLGINNLEMTKGSVGNYIMTKNIPNNVRSSFDYYFEVYSRRSGTLLEKTPVYTALIHTPLGVSRDRLNVEIPLDNRTGRLNGSRTTPEITTDEKFKIDLETYEYAKTVSAIFEYDVKDAVTGQLFKAGTKVPMNQISETSSSKKWSRELIYPTEGVEGTGESELATRIVFEAISENGRDVETDYLTFKLLSYKLENFRVVQIRDFQLTDFYKTTGTGQFKDVSMDVNKMGIDGLSFSPYPVSSLAKGYKFEFEIDSRNFNKDVDTIVITPGFYAINGLSRDPQEKLAYWIDSNKQVRKVGAGSHSKYNQIVLTKENRTITGSLTATWRGEYYIPGTTFLTNPGTTEATAKANALNSDIIVSFNIEGYKNGVPKFNYNVKQWGKERTVVKNPYLIGDVIRYGLKSNLDDLEVIRPR